MIRYDNSISGKGNGAIRMMMTTTNNTAMNNNRKRQQLQAIIIYFMISKSAYRVHAVKKDLH